MGWSWVRDEDNIGEAYLLASCYDTSYRLWSVWVFALSENSEDGFMWSARLVNDYNRVIRHTGTWYAVDEAELDAQEFLESLGFKETTSLTSEEIAKLK